LRGQENRFASKIIQSNVRRALPSDLLIIISSSAACSSPLVVEIHTLEAGENSEFMRHFGIIDGYQAFDSNYLGKS
jgi:hypothetical protein